MGLCSSSPKIVQEVPLLLKLWYHENMRVFHDRLTTEEDREYFKNILASHFESFGLKKEEVLD